MSKLTQERLKQVLHYNPVTGVFTWTNEQSVKKKGKIAGCVEFHGYVRICIDNVKRRAHRLAFLYMNGVMPKDQVDHVNNDPADNRWCNLREASGSENMQNLSSLRSDNTSGYTGVSFVKEKGKFTSSITLEGVFYHLGYFSTAEEAGNAYFLAKEKLHPFSKTRAA